MKQSTAKKDGLPAWMIAQALVVKAKNVLIEESIELLYIEIDSKRMAINGKFIPVDLEKDGEIEQGLFLIRHLIENKDKIFKKLSLEIKELETSKKQTAHEIEKIESTKKFMLAIEKITTSAEYGAVFAEWFNDVSMQVKENDPSKILANTSQGHRTDALKFLINTKMYKDDELFNSEEREYLSTAYSLSQN